MTRNCFDHPLVPHNERAELFSGDTQSSWVSGQLSVSPVVLSAPCQSLSASPVIYICSPGEPPENHRHRRDGAADDDRSAGGRAAVSRLHAGGRAG